MRTALLFALVFALPAPVAGAGTQQPKPHGLATVCHDIQETGSRLRSTRVCMTKEQWEETRRRTQAEIAEGQNRLTSACPPHTRC